MRATLGRRSIQCLILAVLCIMSASCATLPVGDKASKDDEGIVVFSIMPRSYTAIDENQVREVRPIFDYTMWYSSTDIYFFAKHVAPIFGAVGQFGGTIRGSTRYAETFFIRHLPAGEYSIYRVETPTGSVDTDLRFTVTANRITYIGSLQMAFLSKPGLVSLQDPEIYIRVNDDMNDAIMLGNNANSDLGHEVTKNLIKIN